MQDYGNDTYVGPYALDARLLLFNTIAGAIQQDLTQKLSPIPDLSYPCRSYSVQWKDASAYNVGDVIWSFIVGCGAVCLIAAVFAELVMSRLERDPELPAYLNKVCFVAMV